MSQSYLSLYESSTHPITNPVQVGADKLKRELELYGNPPVFPAEAEETANVALVCLFCVIRPLVSSPWLRSHGDAARQG